MTRTAPRPRPSVAVLALASLSAFGGGACDTSSSGDVGRDNAPECTTPNATGGTPAAPLAETEFLAAYSKTYCDAMQNCCGSAGVAFDRTRCEAAASAVFAENVGNPQWHFDPTSAGQCIESMGRFSEICPDYGALALVGLSFACVVYRGSIQPGGTCSTGPECAAPPGEFSACLPEASNPLGAKRCVAYRQDAQLGEPCTASGDSVTEHLGCASGLRCDEEQRSCVPECLLPEGASCDSPDAECADELRCHIETDVCARARATGESCSSDWDCASLDCIEGVCTLELDAQTCYSD